MNAPADAVIFVLLDAFRYDYLARTRFLQQIAPSSVVGTLVEPFGFCPRGAYFGGLSMAEQGYTNLFRFDPKQSIFRWTRQLAGVGPDPRVRDRLRAEIRDRARAVAPPFAAAYLDPVEIPLEWLGYFDVCEVEAPSSRRVGYRSLFHMLEDSGRSWVDVSWPYPGWTGALTSGRVAGLALDQLNSGHSFAYIHLSDLDMMGHAHGPGSREIQTAIEETDRLCELICTRASELFRNPAIVFAGDHGMLPVVRTVNVAAVLADTGLRWGHDFAYFIDSTMVRCWFFTEEARRTARYALAATSGGRLLSEEDRQRWGLAGIDSRNGEDYFLAEPGVLFSPNFFDWTGRHPARGMHGYAPDVADNQALFLAHWPRGHRSGEAGAVDARQLFPTFVDWLGWNASDVSNVPPVRAELPSRRPRWSVNGTETTDAVVDDHLNTIVQAVRSRAPEAEAIVLAGGFGRGEGTVVVDGTVGRPVNDYDVVVVGGDGASLAGLETSLARQLGIDFVELWARPNLPVPDKLSQFDFDLRYGSRLLWGNPLLIDRLPRYAPTEIGVDEGVFQIGNRSGGMLLALTGARPGADSPELFLTRQTTKFLTAIADCWLMAHADYHSSYAIRQRRFRDLATGTFSPSVLHSIDAAFTSKLEGTAPELTSDAAAAAAVARTALNELETALGWSRDRDAWARALAASTARRIRGGNDWLTKARARGLVASRSGQGDVPGCVAAIFRGCLEGLRSWPGRGDSSATTVVAALSPQFDVDVPETDALLPAIAETWLNFYH